VRGSGLSLCRYPSPASASLRHPLPQGERERKRAVAASRPRWYQTPMRDKSKKPQKLRARLPRGLEDRGPAAISATRAMVDRIRAVYELYGFEPVETPTLSTLTHLASFCLTRIVQMRASSRSRTMTSSGSRSATNLTAPLARYVAERYGTDKLVLPYRSYRFGYVYRNEKPGPGRFRQFMPVRTLTR